MLETNNYEQKKYIKRLEMTVDNQNDNLMRLK